MDGQPRPRKGDGMANVSIIVAGPAHRPVDRFLGELTRGRAAASAETIGGGGEATAAALEPAA